MNVGKSVLFIMGLAVGGALMYAIPRLDKPPVRPAPESEVVRTPVTKTVSPFEPVSTPQPAPAPVEEAADNRAAVATDVTPDLLARITDAELRISELEVTLQEMAESDDEVLQPDPALQDTGSANLELAGFEPSTVETIKTIRDEAQLARLELRDRATREGGQYRSVQSGAERAKSAP